MIDDKILSRPNWNAPTNIIAFTTQIPGGVSRKPYYSLNVGAHVGDDQAAVDTNRSLLPFNEHIYWLNQTHSDTAIQLPNITNQADAAYTGLPNIACAVMTADCLPVLLTDMDGQTVCAIHAGWQGLLLGIINKSIKTAFQKIPRHNIIAWIGPHIRHCHYEVDLALAKRFDQYLDAFQVVESTCKAMLDMESVAVQQLQQAGIDNISISGECTYCESQKYFSFRRATHQGFDNCGRMVSMIMKQK